jgi:hypothetical protein
LPAISLRIRTGKFLEACRELEQVIREIIRPIKEFGILDDIGALKAPFLAHTGRKFDRFPDATASPSCTLSS